MVGRREAELIIAQVQSAKGVKMARLQQGSSLLPSTFLDCQNHSPLALVHRQLLRRQIEQKEVLGAEQEQNSRPWVKKTAVCSRITD